MFALEHFLQMLQEYITKNIFKWKEIYTREEANIKDVGLQASRHQNWNCKSIRHSLLPVKRRLGVATPPCKTGWRHPDGVMAVCRDDLWKYGRCFSAQEMERCLGSFYFKWEKRHHASFLKISGCVFDGSDLLTANSCKRNSSRSLWLIYLQKILVSLNP